MTSPNIIAQKERREYIRLDYRNPIKYRFIDEAGQDLKLGTLTNVSPSGLLFSSRILPKIADLIWLDLDLNVVEGCKDIDSDALIYENGLLGRVVRIEESSESDLYLIGICFLTMDNSGQDFRF